MTVLVLSEDTDPTVDRVIEELHGRDVPVFRCDTASFPRRLWLDARFDGEGWAGTLATEDREVDLAGLRSVWYRRPTTFVFPVGLSAPEHRHAMWEAKLGLGGVLAALPVLWCNRPGAEADAAYKPRQLAVASQCGLRTPRTLVTNRPSAVQDFAARVNGDLIIKPLAFNWITEAGVMKGIYTHAPTAEELGDLRGVHTTAHLLQQRVQKSYEVRVTVAGEQVFAVAIHARSEAAQLDWRRDPDHVSYSVIDLPPKVDRGIRDYMAAFGLTFAAFDFAVSREREWIFFEANAGGQFGFVEGHTGLPITAAVADLLTKGIP